MASQAVLLLLSTLLFTLSVHGSAEYDQFSEELLLRHLSDGNLLAHLQFTNRLQVDLEDPNFYNHFSLFPKAMAQMANEFGVEQLKLSFTQGIWSSERWGVPVMASPSGVQVVASFTPETNADYGWKRVCQSLSGMFCASIDSFNEESSADPSLSFQEMLGPQYLKSLKEKADYALYKEELMAELETTLDRVYNLSLEGFMTLNGMTMPSETEQQVMQNVMKSTSSSRQARQDKGLPPPSVRYAELSSEGVCTENLTPWVKLLPCKDAGGFGRLLNPLALYDLLFHAMNVDLKHRKSPLCEKEDEECRYVELELVQSLSLVFDTSEFTDFEVSHLFGTKDAIESCYLANGGSYVYVENMAPIDGNSKHSFGSIPPPSGDLDDGRLHFYNVSSSSPLRLTLHTPPKAGYNLFEFKTKSDVVAHRSQLGKGDEKGAVQTEIKNVGDTPIEITYFEYIPWYLPVYYSSINFHITNTPKAHKVLRGLFSPLVLHSSQWRLEPAIDHSKPSIIEFTVEIPPRSTLMFSYSFMKAFRNWEEHPPDAHRGADVASSCITLAYKEDVPDRVLYTGLDWSPLTGRRKSSDEGIRTRVYTEGLLINMPTPDFSMPYNVIMLSCTMFSTVFTAFITSSTRRYGYLKSGEEYSSARLSTWVYRKIRDFIFR